MDAEIAGSMTIRATRFLIALAKSRAARLDYDMEVTAYGAGGSGPPARVLHEPPALQDPIKP